MILRRMPLLCSFVVFCLVLFFITCNGDDDDNPTRSISGTVYDQHYKPLSNASVRVDNKETITDSQGRYTLPDLAVDCDTITASYVSQFDNESLVLHTKVTNSDRVDFVLSTGGNDQFESGEIMGNVGGYTKYPAETNLRIYAISDNARCITDFLYDGAATYHLRVDTGGHFLVALEEDKDSTTIHSYYIQDKIEVTADSVTTANIVLDSEQFETLHGSFPTSYYEFDHGSISCFFIFYKTRSLFSSGWAGSQHFDKTQNGTFQIQTVPEFDGLERTITLLIQKQEEFGSGNLDLLFKTYSESKTIREVDIQFTANPYFIEIVSPHPSETNVGSNPYFSWNKERADQVYKIALYGWVEAGSRRIYWEIDTMGNQFQIPAGLEVDLTNFTTISTIITTNSSWNEDFAIINPHDIVATDYIMTESQFTFYTKEKP